VHVQQSSNSRSVKQKSTLTTSNCVGTNNANFGGHSKQLFYLYTLMSEKQRTLSAIINKSIV
jgi:hypothetical protein